MKIRTLTLCETCDKEIPKEKPDSIFLAQRSHLNIAVAADMALQFEIDGYYCDKSCLDAKIQKLKGEK